MRVNAKKNEITRNLSARGQQVMIITPLVSTFPGNQNTNEYYYGNASAKISEIACRMFFLFTSGIRRYFFLFLMQAFKNKSINIV